MNKYWERVGNRKAVQDYVEYKDINDFSVLDYCKMRNRQDIYSTIKCFCTDGNIISYFHRI